MLLQLVNFIDFHYNTVLNLIDIYLFNVFVNFFYIVNVPSDIYLLLYIVNFYDFHYISMFIMFDIYLYDAFMNFLLEYNVAIAWSLLWAPWGAGV